MGIFAGLTFVVGQIDLTSPQKESPQQATADAGWVMRGDMPGGLHGERVKKPQQKPVYISCVQLDETTHTHTEYNGSSLA